jgi:hypothetical protein
MRNDFEEQLHRTFLEYLLQTGQRELAAAAVDGAVQVNRDYNGYALGLFLDLPSAGYHFIARNEVLQQVATKALRAAAHGHLWDADQKLLVDYDIEFRMKLADSESGWREIVRDMIVNYKGSNQGMLTQILAARNGRPTFAYNELRYASQAEIKIAMELEARKVLFFPLAVGVRADTGEPWQDHREVDFLVCLDGVWGILEVAYHPDRYEKDSEKAAWFKRSGILCIEHRTAEACYNTPAQVVSDFLAILAKHKR